MTRGNTIKSSVEMTPAGLCINLTLNTMSVPLQHLHCSRLECRVRTECPANADGSTPLSEEGFSPVARYGHSLVEIQPDVLFLFGGVSKDRECLNDAWVLRLQDSNVVSRQLEIIGDLPCCRFAHSAHCTLDSKSVIIFGGSNNVVCYNDIHVASVEELASKQSVVVRRIDVSLTPPPHPSPPSSLLMYSSAPAPGGFTPQLHFTTSWPEARRSHTLTPIEGGKSILFGGYAITSFDDVWLLDERLFEWKCLRTTGLNPKNPLADTPKSRYCHTAVVYPHPIFSSSTAIGKGTAPHRCLYVFGGFLFSTTGDNVLWELNLTTYVWCPVKVRNDIIPPARFGHTACVLLHSMIVFGGTDKFPAGRALDEFFIFNFRSYEWQHFKSDQCQRLAPHPTSVSGTTGITCKDRNPVYFPKTRSGQLPLVFRLGWRCCPMGERFHGCMPPGRRLHAAALSSRGKIVIFGGWDGTHVESDFLQLVLTPPTLRESSYNFLRGAHRLV